MLYFRKTSRVCYIITFANFSHTHNIQMVDDNTSIKVETGIKRDSKGRSGDRVLHHKLLELVRVVGMKLDLPINFQRLPLCPNSFNFYSLRCESSLELDFQFGYLFGLIKSKVYPLMWSLMKKINPLILRVYFNIYFNGVLTLSEFQHVSSLPSNRNFFPYIFLSPFKTLLTLKETWRQKTYFWVLRFMFHVTFTFADLLVVSDFFD